MAALTSQLIVSLVDRVTAPSRAIAASISRLTAAQTRNTQRMNAVRGQMLEAAAVAYGLARAISAPVRAATEFETTLEDIGQKLNVPVAGLPKLGEEVREVARATTQSAAEIAAGLDVLAGMGASREDALGLLDPIGKAATAYNASIADLSQAGYAALDNLKVPANEFGRALDAMAAAGKAGAFELRDMAQYFPALGAAYQGLGQTGVASVADLSAALQVVRKGAGDSAEAATNLSNILQKVYAPQTIKAFSKIGIDLRKEMEKAAQAGMTPIEAITEITSRALKGDLSRLGDLFSDAQVQKGLRPLIQNIELYRQIRAEALAAQGVVEEDYERRLQTGAMATQRWKIAMESLNLAIGGALLPALTSLANDLIPIVNRMAAWADAHPALTRAIVATTAGLVGLRVAGIAAQFAFLWMKGGVLMAAIAGMKGLGGAVKVAALAFTPFGAAARSARAAMVGFTSAASIAGTGSALKIMGTSLLGLLNPLRLVTAALRVLKVAVIGTGIGAVLVGIAMAGAWIYNNWSGISTMFEAFKGAFARAIEPIMPAIQPVLDGFTWLYDKVAGLLGPVDELGGGWAAAGLAAGKFVGDTLVALVELPGKIVGLAGEIAAAAAGWGQAIYDSVVAGAGQAGQALVEAISVAVERVKAFALDMYAAGAALMAQLLEGIKAGAQAVLSYVSEIGSRIKSSISNAASNAWSNVKSAVGLGDSPAVDAARAAGGPVRAGGTYLVGERGPELVTFPQAGFVHDALKTVRIMRNAALASAVSIPAVAAPAMPSFQPQGSSAQATVTAPNINVGGIRIEVHAAPGQSPEQIAAAVERMLSAKLNALSRGAHSDGVN